MRWILFLTAILLCNFSHLAGQTTLRENRSEKTFQQAHELFLKEKYAAAQALFLQFCQSSDNYLMVADARHYVALCAAELLNADAPLLHDNLKKNHPENTSIGQSHYALGKYYFRQKNYSKALLEFIEIDPFILLPDESKEYYFMTGYCQFHEGNIHEAKPYFKEIVNFSGNYYHLSNYFYGYITFEENDFDEALKAFYRIEDHESFKTIMPVYITEVYALMKDYDKVIEYGSKALEKKDVQKQHVIHLLLAQAYFKKSDFKKAKEHYDVYARKNRILSAEDTYQYGYASLVNDDYSTAIQQFENFVIESDSIGQNVSYHLAGAYLKAKKKLEARNAFSFAMNDTLDKKITEDAHYNFAKLSYELKFHKEAIKSFESFLKTYPKSPHIEDVKEQFVRILLASNNYGQAFAVIEEMKNPSEKINGAYQRLGFNIGLEYFEIKNYVKAREYFNKSLKRPVYGYFKALCHFWIGESLFLEERYKEALTAYKNFLVVPECKETEYLALANYNIGYCHIKQKQHKDALYYFDEYLKNKNDIYTRQFNADVYARRADCYQELRLYDKAIENYDKVLSLNYVDMDYALYQKGMIYGLKDEKSNKIKVLLQLTDEYPNSTYFDEALYQLGNEHMLIGNRMQALREFQFLNQEFPNNHFFSVAQIKMGIIYNQVGDFEKAIEMFDIVIERFPTSVESKEALSVMKDIYVQNNQVEKYYEKIDTIPNISVSAHERDSAMFTQAIITQPKGCKESIKAYDKYLNAFEQGLFTLEILDYKAKCLVEAGDVSGALACYDRIIENRPNLRVENALINATLLCFENDSFNRVIPYLQLQEEITNDPTALLEVYEGMARAYLEIDSCNLAQAYLSKISRFEGADSLILSKADYTLARCQMKNGNNSEAITLFQKVADDNNSKLGAEAQYLVAYLLYLEGNYDSSKTAVIKVRDNFAPYEYFVAKSFILMADNFVKMDKLSAAKGTLKNIVEYYEGEDLKKVAEEKLKAIEAEEERRKKEQELIQKNQEDSIEYNDKTE